jgi:hypothetical protein
VVIADLSADTTEVAAIERAFEHGLGETTSKIVA